MILSISYLAVGAMLIRCHRETLFLVRRNWTLLAMVILALASCLWAEAPAFTFRRSVAVATSLWPLAFPLLFLLYNLGECTIFLQDLQWGIDLAIVAASGPALSAHEAAQEDEIFFEPGEELA